MQTFTWTCQIKLIQALKCLQIGLEITGSQNDQRMTLHFLSTYSEVDSTVHSLKQGSAATRGRNTVVVGFFSESLRFLHNHLSKQPQKTAALQ